MVLHTRTPKQDAGDKVTPNLADRKYGIDVMHREQRKIVNQIQTRKDNIQSALRIGK